MDEKAKQVIKIVANLALRVLGGRGYQLFLERDGELVRVEKDGAFPHLETETIKIGQGATGQVFERRKLLYSPLREDLAGPAEGGYKSVAASPLWASLEADSPVYGVLVVGYDELIQPTKAGRRNLGQFAWAIAQVIEVYREKEEEEIQDGGEEKEYQWDSPAAVLSKDF